ncbi:uncharacterized protein LOC122072111 [Macadamia integrifolia]|uniref:uncharacterized protein LOC122072111 n=1 Tax=Macadamia integrifolia TaxID=60698 RepID=UPI001C4F004B|nr:uncharacterized protein LOC122072111 [Macadamia integrifolia]
MQRLPSGHIFLCRQELTPLNRLCIYEISTSPFHLDLQVLLQGLTSNIVVEYRQHFQLIGHNAKVFDYTRMLRLRVVTLAACGGWADTPGETSAAGGTSAAGETSAAEGGEVGGAGRKSREGSEVGGAGRECRGAEDEERDTRALREAEDKGRCTRLRGAEDKGGGARASRGGLRRRVWFSLCCGGSYMRTVTTAGVGGERKRKSSLEGGIGHKTNG